MVRRLAPHLGLDPGAVPLRVHDADHDGPLGGARAAAGADGLLIRPSALADPDPALFAHELAHLAQHRNRATAAVTCGSAPGVPGRRPSVTEAEAEAAALADAARYGTPLWHPRAVLPDGHLARVSGSTGVMPARPSDAGPGNTPNPGVPSLQPAVAAGQTAATLSALTDVVRRTHSAELDRIKAEMSTFGEIAPDKRDYALSLLDQVPFVVAGAMVRALDSDQRQRLAQLSDRDHQRHPAAAVAVLAALKTDEMDALGDKLIKGKDAALHGVQFGRLEPTALRALYGVLGQLRDSQLAQLTGGDQRDYFRGRLAIAPPEGSDQDALESAFNNESEQDKVSRTSIGESGTPGGSQGALIDLSPTQGVDTARQAGSALFHLARYDPHGGRGRRHGGHPLPPQRLLETIRPIWGDDPGVNDGPESRLAWEWDPAEWARKAAAVARHKAFLLIRTGIIVTLATNTSYAYDAEGESLREIPVRLPGQLRQTSAWWLDVAHNQWSMPPGVLLGDFSPPLSEQDVKTLCDAMGFIYGGPGTFWVLLDLEPDLVFARPRPMRPPAEDTSAMRHKAKEAVEDLAAAWRDRPAHEGSALVGTPVFKERYSGRTGWHIRITLDQEKTEVPLRQGDTDKDVRARVEAAVAKMRAKYQPGPARRPLPAGAKSDPRAAPPPPWYVPFEGHPAVQGGQEGANAPPLPAVVLYKAEEANTHPTVMAGASYDFRMQVQWQFAGQFGLYEAMNAGYYWELLAAAPADWFRLSGEKPPEPAPGVSGDPPSANAPAPGPVPAGRSSTAPGGAGARGGSTTPTELKSAPAHTEDVAVGSGTRITRKSDLTAARRAESRHVGGDMANDYEEGDYAGFAGEAVAGGFRIVKTQVVSAIGDILDYRDPSSRRVEFPEPGYYLIRCISSATTSGKDPDKDFIRSPSVAVIPVKAQLNWAVAKASAMADLAKAATQGTFARYAAELASTRSTLDAARKLQARFTGDPTLRGRLTADPVAVASQLTVPELGVLVLAEQNRISVDQLVSDLATQVKEAEGSDHEKTVTSWHDELQKAPDGTTDYPVGATFIAEDTGQVIPLRLMVGQAKDSSDAAPHWIVFDITTEKSRDCYDGKSAVSGAHLTAAAGGHAAALGEALSKFAGENPYGYGEIGLAWPASFGGVNIKGGELPRHLRSAPDAVQRKKHRHTAYVDIATFIIPAAKAAKLRGLVTAAETFVALVGAKNAIDTLKDRSRTSHLYEPGTLLELVQVIGAVKTLGEGGKFLLEANEFVRAARRVGTSLELLTKLEQGLQILSIPLMVREQLDAIDAMTTASGEHKAAMLAFVMGRAIRDGVVTVRAIHPGEETRFYDDSKEAQYDEVREHVGTPQPGRQATGHPSLHEGETPETRPEHVEQHSGGGGGVGGEGGGVGGGAGGGRRWAGPVPGMSDDTVKTLRDFCTAYGVVIDVRPTTATAPEWRGVGAVPKPEAIKAKTINEYDRLLGAPPGAVGLIGYFEPKEPKRPPGMDDADFAKLQGRYLERADEFKKLAGDMAALQQDGRVRVRHGVVELLDPRKGGDHYAPGTGDHDLFDIQWANGKPMSDAQADGFAALLRSMNIGVEHPAHMRWKPTSLKDVKQFKDIIAQHTPGEAFKSNLVRFTPKELPQEVAAGTPVTPTRQGPHTTWDVHVTDPGHAVGDQQEKPGGGGAGGGDGGYGGPPGSAIPPHLHGSLQQFADVHRVAINVRGDPRGGLRVEVQWAGTRNVPSPREMNSTERQAFNKMLVDMNIGVIPSGDVTNAPAVIVRIEPQPETAATQPPSQHGTGQDLRIDEVPSRVGQPGYEELAPEAADIPGRAELNEVEQRALDRYVGRMRRRRQMTEHLEGELRAASTDELRRRLQQAINEQPRVDEERRRAEQVRGSNAPDPRQAQFDHERDEGGGVTSRWNGNEPPSKREVNQATEVAEATGEHVVLYGNNFSGVDGTIGANPPRLLQLKSAQDGPTLIRVLTEARQNAQRHGDRGLEVHVLARELSLAQASDELRRTPVPFGSWLGRVTIHVRGGHFEVPPSGRL
jgi:hypothetical protein